jgi:hypothetical protein
MTDKTPNPCGSDSSTEFDLLTRLRFALADPECKLTASQLTRRAHEIHQKAAKWDDWHEAQNNIETQMPQGWRFVLDCSPGDWSLDLVDPDGNHVEFDHDCDSTAQMIRSAISCAREKAGVLSNS